MLFDKVKYSKVLFVAISGICLGIFQGYRATLDPMCLPTMTQAGREHVIQFISLVYADGLRTVFENW